MASSHEGLRRRGSRLGNRIMEPVTVTVKNAMAAIGIRQTKIYELINNGTLETVRVGRRRLVKTASIRALVDQAA